MSDLIEKIQDLKSNLEQTGALLNLASKKQKILELEDEMQKPSFWQEKEKAKKVNQELAELKDKVVGFEEIVKETEEFLSLAEEGEKAKDNSLGSELEKKLKKLEKEAVFFSLKALLSGKYDENNAILAIHAGTGGVDAQDWAQMLERMYLRYCENKPARCSLGEGWKFKVNILDRQVASEAGIKSVILEVVGKYAYGYLQSEAGVHRLVRISPFDAEKMRHTSFALVEVLPELEEVPEIELKEDELEIETFRSSGPGGQSVNKTSSAVRLRHKPTGITVTCQNERSQLQNKQTALKVLKSRLRQYNEAEQEEEKKKLRGEFSEATWGNQIRSYVLQPYHLVKDHRTNYETQEVEKVLGGGLDEVVESYLKWKTRNKE